MSPKLYSNRAMCYTKLMSFDLSLKDCDKAIELDPKFIKAYLRKANAQKGQLIELLTRTACPEHSNLQRLVVHSNFVPLFRNGPDVEGAVDVREGARA